MPETTSRPRILLGVTGSIAAYKAADLAGKLAQAGLEVHVAMTAHAAEFIGPATFRALTGNPVLTGVFDEPVPGEMAHIDVAQSASLCLVAPATANILAKMAHGIADDALSTLLLATTAPVLVAPAMNTHMLAHPATQANLATLRERGATVLEPGTGRLACGAVGAGRLADVAGIVEAVNHALARRTDLAGKRLLITAGATREPLDPVRFISNRSSGRMGCALAAAAAARGAQVVLVAAHMDVEPPCGVEVVRVSTTAAMLTAAAARFGNCDALVAAAAPCDFAPADVAKRKIKKQADGSGISLDLVPTPDILATLSARRASQVLVGFAAETNDLVANATAKLQRKGLDLMVANDVTAPGAGFEVETNQVTLLGRDGRPEPLPLLTKREVADRILDAMLPLLASS